MIKPHKPRYSKRDYEMVAGVIHQNALIFSSNEATSVHVAITARFIAGFKEDNPAFDVLKFTDAIWKDIVVPELLPTLKSVRRGKVE